MSARKAASRTTSGSRGSKSVSASKRKSTATKKPAAKKPVAKKAAAKKTAPKKAAARKAAPKKAAAKKPAPKKAAAKKPAPKKAAAKKPVAKKAAAKKGAAKKPLAKNKRKKVGRAAPTLPSAPESGAPSEDGGARKFGLRGAAPWVARHAARRAEEMRRRNAEPPPPGSARATLRRPPKAEELKSQISALHQRTSKIRTLRKRLDKNFYEIGQLLAEVQRQELYEAKGYNTFETFLDREVDLPRSLALRLVRITVTFVRDTAYDFGIERLSSALAALDGEIAAAPPSMPSSRGWSSPGMPPKPPRRFGG